MPKLFGGCLKALQRKFSVMLCNPSYSQPDVGSDFLVLEPRKVMFLI